MSSQLEQYFQLLASLPVVSIQLPALGHQLEVSDLLLRLLALLHRLISIPVLVLLLVQKVLQVLP